MARLLNLLRPAVDWSTAPDWATLWSYKDGKAYWVAEDVQLDVTTLEDLACDKRRTITVYKHEKHEAPTFGWTGRPCVEPRPSVQYPVL